MMARSARYFAFLAQVRIGHDLESNQSLSGSGEFHSLCKNSVPDFVHQNFSGAERNLLALRESYLACQFLRQCLRKLNEPALQHKNFLATSRAADFLKKL